MRMSFQEAQSAYCEKNMLHSGASEMDEEECLENEAVGSNLNFVKMGCVCREWAVFCREGCLRIVLILLMFLSLPCTL